tara:strand:+ start:210 stop:725 length:516 start_codon:yes stop_codon:yes gene_type:complete
MEYKNNNNQMAQQFASTPDVGNSGLLPQKNLKPSQEGNTNVTLVRTGFNKEAFEATFNRAFTELGVGEADLSFFDPNLATVDTFFTIYSNLFFLIPKFGDINSHEYLIKESSEYIDFQANQEEIQALLDEIAELRETNLQLQIDMASILSTKRVIEQAEEISEREVEGSDG